MEKLTGSQIGQISSKTIPFEKAKTHLSDVNWNFSDSPTFFDSEVKTFNTRKYLNYPGTYVPSIPYSLIENLTKKSAVVLDPFVGSGTTFFQALILGRIPLGVDTNMVSYEYIKSLYLLFDPKLDKGQVIPNIISLFAELSEEGKNHVVKGSHEYYDRLSGWFSPETFARLRLIIESIRGLEDDATRITLHLAIMATIQGLSSQDRGYGCIADNMLPKPNQFKDKDVYSVVLSKCRLLIRDIEDCLSRLGGDYLDNYSQIDLNRSLFHQDIRLVEEIKDNSIDCIVSSPPYPNMADYITSQRLVYYYLECNPDKDKFIETGARFKRNRKTSLKDYSRDMSLINKKLAEMLKPSGYFVYVLPDFGSKKNRDTLRKEIVEGMVDELPSFGLVKRDEIERLLPIRRRSHNASWATLEKEKIIIYQKE